MAGLLPWRLSGRRETKDAGWSLRIVQLGNPPSRLAVEARTHASGSTAHVLSTKLVIKQIAGITDFLHYDLALIL